MAFGKGKMKVCVFGLWHLGSVIAGCLAKLGCSVNGLDFDQKVIADLNQGKAPLHEPGLDELIKDAVKNKTADFFSDPKIAVTDADVLWVGFDTPVDDNDVADIDFLENNIKKIMPYFKEGIRVIISSQAPVGFTARLESIFAESYPFKKAFFACSPENLRLGNAIDVFLNPDRIVVGIRNTSEEKQFLPIFSLISDKIEWMKTESAEMTKHAINSFLAMSVCFANEVATICERVGANANEVERGLKTECRIGPKAYVGPGVAFSGGTLARDINFLEQLSCKYKLSTYLINSVNQSNDAHKSWVKNKSEEVFKDLKGRRFAFLGLTYKPGTNTLRRSFAVELAKIFHEHGALINAFDPAIKTLDERLKKIISLKNNINEAVAQSDAVVIMTQWNEFKNLKEDEINLISQKVVIDPNGFLEDLFIKRAIKYFAVGRGNQESR